MLRWGLGRGCKGHVKGRGQLAWLLRGSGDVGGSLRGGGACTCRLCGAVSRRGGKVVGGDKQVTGTLRTIHPCHHCCYIMLRHDCCMSMSLVPTTEALLHALILQWEASDKFVTHPDRVCANLFT